MSDDREQLFLADLQELLNKHKAELQVGDNGQDYGMHNGICTISFEFDPDLPYLEFNLPTYMRAERNE